MYLIVSASPNTDGLTASCAAAALAGFLDTGSDAQHIDLCKLELGVCQQCGQGWGTCLHEHECSLDDQLRMVYDAISAAEGLVIVTPVYYGEMSERAKAVFDRLRRCETMKGENSILLQKPVIAIAAAGGTGGGITSCLSSMERLIQHMRGQVFDLIGVTQRSKGYMVDAIQAAASSMARWEAW